MPRFFFNTADGSRDVDTVGVELADQATARKQAVRFAGEVMNDDPTVLWDGCDFNVEVVDEQGELLFVVSTHVVDTPK